MKKKVLRIGFVLVAFWMLATLPPAFATITVVTSPPNPLTDVQFQQTTNAPCVIGDMSCDNGAFVYAGYSGTPGGNNGSTYDLFSHNVTSNNPLGLDYVVVSGNPFTPAETNVFNIPSSFSIGVDENIAKGAGQESLVFFKTFVNGALDAGNSYIPATPFLIPDLHNGNGFSDFILAGFSLPVGATVYFEASVSNDSDGMEEFFIIPQGTPPSVPEPGTLLMLGCGLMGLVGLKRKFRE